MIMPVNICLKLMYAWTVHLVLHREIVGELSLLSLPHGEYQKKIFGKTLNQLLII